MAFVTIMVCNYIVDIEGHQCSFRCIERESTSLEDPGCRVPIIKWPPMRVAALPPLPNVAELPSSPGRFILSLDE